MAVSQADLLKVVLKFRRERDWEKFETLANLAKSITIEAAELLEHFQWQEDNFNLQEVKYELADVYVYLLVLAHVLQLDLNQVALEKMAINSRRYPVSESKGRRIKPKKP